MTVCIKVLSECFSACHLYMLSLTTKDAVIGLEETSYTTPESGTVEVCASLLQGQLERNTEVVLSTQDGEAIGLL